jgi:hypothetical protein
MLIAIEPVKLQPFKVETFAYLSLGADLPCKLKKNDKQTPRTSKHTLTKVDGRAPV